MKEVYINVTINYCGTYKSARLVQSIDDGPLYIKQIPLEKAKKLIWELKLAGGEREVYVSPKNRNTCIVSGYIFLRM